MFLISEKKENPRILIAEITHYSISDDGEKRVYYISFFPGYDNRPVRWLYDSKDERDRILGNVDEKLGYDGNSGMKARRC